MYLTCKFSIMKKYIIQQYFLILVSAHSWLFQIRTAASIWVRHLPVRYSLLVRFEMFTNLSSELLKLEIPQPGDGLLYNHFIFVIIMKIPHIFISHFSPLFLSFRHWIIMKKCVQRRWIKSAFHLSLSVCCCHSRLFNYLSQSQAMLQEWSLQSTF